MTASRIVVHDIDVDWREGFINDPSLALLVEGCDWTEARWEKRPLPDRPGSSVYWTEQDGLVRFFLWHGKPDDGYGGWRRTITLIDGSEEEIIGGWSTCPEIATAAGFPAVTGVAVVEGDGDSDEGWKRRGGLACFMTVKRLKRELARHRPDLELMPSRYGSFTVRRRRGRRVVVAVMMRRAAAIARSASRRQLAALRRLAAVNTATEVTIVEIVTTIEVRFDGS